MKKHFLLLCLFILCSCSKKEKQEHLYTFYYWKTQLSLNKKEEKTLEKSTSQKLYTRFFDLDKRNGKFQPLGVLEKDSTFTTSKEIVPVIFITNRTFLNITPEEMDFLVEKTFELLQKKNQNFQFPSSDEIQIDCDWTAGTKADYFTFLKKLKSISQKNITSTLRLHQVKDKKKMGVPPVEKVYLMCYSTSSPLENSDKNSILDVALLKNYLQDLDNYPLKMDIALPIYSWGIITNHLGKHLLINGLNSKDLDHPNFKKINDNEAIVLKDDFYFGKYLNKGFHIKIEAISTKQREEVVRFIENKITNFNIVYYQLDEKFIQEKL